MQRVIHLKTDGRQAASLNAGDEKILMFIIPSQLLRAGYVPMVQVLPYKGKVTDICIAVSEPTTEQVLSLNVQHNPPMSTMWPMISVTDLELPVGERSINFPQDVDVVAGETFRVYVNTDMSENVGYCTIHIKIQIKE